MSETSDIGTNGRRLAALARKLDASPREVLALACRLASAKDEIPPGRAHIDAELARVRAAGTVTAAAIEMMLLGYHRYAFDDIDRALRIVWDGSNIGDA
jgi:hypothetical protein